MALVLGFSFPCLSSSPAGTMAPIVLTPAEVKAAMDTGTSELKYLFSREEVSVEESIQAIFFHIKVRSPGQLATFAESRDDLKTVLRESFGLDPTNSLEERVKVSAVVTAWEMSKMRSSKQAELEGELEARKLVRPLPMNEYLSMRLAFEKRWWELDNESIPARCYVEKRADDLQSGDFRAEMLTTVLQRDQEDPDLLTTTFDATGKMVIKRGNGSIAEPANPEALRKRIKLLGYTLIMLGLRHTNVSVLQGLTPQLFEEFLSYILGEHVYGLVGKSSEGFTVSAPSWNQILVYEHNIRKKAFDRMQLYNENLALALKTAWQDPITKERFLTTPMALSSSSQKRHAVDGQQGSGKFIKNRKGGKGGGKGGGGKGNGKGGGKSGGKGGGKGSGGGRNSHTPEGKPICFAYNNPNEKCTNRSCSFWHVCARCFGKHAAHACPGNAGRGPETQGDGTGNE